MSSKILSINKLNVNMDVGQIDWLVSFQYNNVEHTVIFCVEYQGSEPTDIIADIYEYDTLNKESTGRLFQHEDMYSDEWIDFEDSVITCILQKEEHVDYAAEE